AASRRVHYSDWYFPHARSPRRGSCGEGGGLECGGKASVSNKSNCNSLVSSSVLFAPHPIEQRDSREQSPEADPNVLPSAGEKNIAPAKECNCCRQGIEQHLVRTLFRGQPLAQQGQGKDLSDELHENARGQQRADHLVKPEEGRDNCHGSERQQRDIRKIFRGMQPRERLEKISINSRSVGDA